MKKPPGKKEETLLGSTSPLVICVYGPFPSLDFLHMLLYPGRPSWELAVEEGENKNKLSTHTNGRHDRYMHLMYNEAMVYCILIIKK